MMRLFSLEIIEQLFMHTKEADDSANFTRTFEKEGSSQSIIQMVASCEVPIKIQIRLNIQDNPFLAKGKDVSDLARNIDIYPFRTFGRGDTTVSCFFYDHDKKRFGLTDTLISRFEFLAEGVANGVITGSVGLDEGFEPINALELANSFEQS